MSVFNWSFFEAKSFTFNELSDGFEPKKMLNYELEFFEYIQKISIKNKLILLGFSKESGCWLEYHFANCEYSLE